MPYSSYRTPATRKRLADMTPAQQLAYQITRVEQLGLRVVATGTFKADGTPFWLVPSTSEKLKNMHHVVKKTAKGLTCDCYASSESGLVCPHRACVYVELKRQASQPVTKAQPAPAVSSPDRPQVKFSQPAGQARPSKETALPYDDGRAFSIFKPEREDYVPRDYVSHQYR